MSYAPIPAADQAEGEARKAAAHLLLESRREALLRRARRALLTELLTAGTATIDAVRAVVLLPPRINPKFFSPEPGTPAEKGLI
jgi:hypothetical protein